MTTASWNTPLQHTTDAQFRAWGSEISAKLAAIGLVQAADTGQINWGTVLRPGTNTVAGYEIWRFDDALQGSAPIFFKLEYGTSTSATSPATYLTVATGSNGSGTLTGQSTARVACFGNAIAASATNWASYACAVDGLAWIMNKYGFNGANICNTGFAIQRTCDSSGVPTATGFVVYTRDLTPTIGPFANIQTVRTVAAAQTFAATTTQFACLLVHNVSTTFDGVNVQAALHWTPTPKVAPLVGVCTMLITEAAVGSTFPTTLVGTTPRTYLSIGTAMGQGSTSTAASGLCWIYE